MKTLEDVRREIDRLDSELVGLLEERIELSLQVKEIKAKDKTAVLDASREEKIIDKLKGLMPEEHHEYLKKMYQLIFEYSRSLQK
jgi:monofunctional chorismate mutase